MLINPRMALLLGLPAALLAACLYAQPFSKNLVEKHWSTRSLSAAQLANLAVAARRLDGLVLKPGERFSFNRVVGPRTMARGYRPAPSYLGGDSPATLGGGICLLSSAVYQVVLESGMDIQQRVPHLRTIHSVPPGLDATVWYGGADLAFINTLQQPVRLVSRLDRQGLLLQLQGRDAIQPAVIGRVVQQRNPQELFVTVFRARKMVSRDLYRLSP